MHNEKELTDAILKITMSINEKFPELQKYVNEMPVSVPDADNPEINIKTLADYKHSLESLLKKYEKSHISESKTIL